MLDWKFCSQGPNDMQRFDASNEQCKNVWNVMVREQVARQREGCNKLSFWAYSDISMSSMTNTFTKGNGLNQFCLETTPTELLNLFALCYFDHATVQVITHHGTQKNCWYCIHFRVFLHLFLYMVCLPGLLFLHCLNLPRSIPSGEECLGIPEFFSSLCSNLLCP